MEQAKEPGVNMDYMNEKIKELTLSTDLRRERRLKMDNAEKKRVKLDQVK